MPTDTHDSPTRLTPAQWREQATKYALELPNRYDLVLFCLNQAVLREAEGERTIAQMLTEGVTV